MSDAKKQTSPAKHAYDVEYINKFIRQRKINFNIQMESDVELLNWLDGQPNKNQYVKNLIRDDMKRSGK